ncbi:hypothetical protein GH5_01521 [Leishmania sp. Ghana 2012 LV757]|uniref:hypothetical protein n=1 Tax=Leishmania sp. Ghana 2012 LV757 TaxID=2803181 RepID=UPI001B703DC2|nr:hypothetical protein GH5_01521 [Leishmania sp. Ghana 2012 LV757]
MTAPSSAPTAEGTASPFPIPPVFEAPRSGAVQLQPQPQQCYRYYQHPHHTTPSPQPAPLEYGRAGDGSLPSAQEAATPVLPVVSPADPYSPHPVMYAPWGMMPPPTAGTSAHQPPATLGAPPSPMTAAGVAQGTPAISLGLQVPLRPTKQVLTCYTLLLLALMMAIGLLLVSFFAPICTAHLSFTRSVTDIQDHSAYLQNIKGDFGKDISTYALFSPCTVFKQHACDIITAGQVSEWMQFVINGMQAPYPDLLFYSGIDRARVSSCSYVHLPAATTRPAPQPRGIVPPKVIGRRALHHGDGPAPPAPPLHKHRGPRSGSSGLAGVPTSVPEEESHASPPRRPPGLDDNLGRNDAPHVLPAAGPLIGGNTNHVLIALNSSVPHSAEAAFTLTCDGDADTAPMLNLTAVHHVDVSAYLLNGNSANSSKVVSAVDLITTAEPHHVGRGYTPRMSTCAEYLEACRTAGDGYYVVVAPASPLYRCGQGSIGSTRGPSNISQTVAKVLVCDLTFYELGVDTVAALRFTARAQVAMKMVLYPASARFPDSATAAPVSLTLSAILLVFADAFVLLALVLMAVTAVTVPVQRAKLRQLSAALEADASVAMGILYRAQGAVSVTMPPTAAPAAATFHGPNAEVGHPVDTAADAFTILSTSLPTVPPQPRMQTQQQSSPAHTSLSALAAAASPMLILPPYYESGGMVPPGVGGSGTALVSSMMVVVPPMMPRVAGNAPSPYSEGYYLQPEHGSSNTAALQSSAADDVVAAVDTPHAPLASAAAPPETEARHGGSYRTTTTFGASGAASSGTSPLTQEESAVRGSSGVQEVSVPEGSPPLAGWHPQQHRGTDGVALSGDGTDSGNALELASLQDAGSSFLSPPSPGGSDTGTRERAIHEGAGQRSASSPSGISYGVDGGTVAPMWVLAAPGASLASGHHPVLFAGNAHAAEVVPPPALISMQNWQPPMTPSAVTDWMFMSSRHVVSQDVLEESVASESTAEEPEEEDRWWRLRRLRDRVLRRRRASAAGAPAPSNWPDSDSDDGMPGADYVPVENSPGERTIQLFLLRARKSYTRLRRKQVSTSATLLFYAKAAAIAALVFAIVATGLQLWNVAARNRERLQLRGGDTLTDDYVLDPSHLALMSLSLACLLVVMLLTFVVERKRVW